MAVADYVDVNLVKAQIFVPADTVSTLDIQPAVGNVGKFYFAKITSPALAATNLIKIIFKNQSASDIDLKSATGINQTITWADILTDTSFRELILDRDNYIQLYFYNGYTLSQYFDYQYYWTEVG